MVNGKGRSLIHGLLSGVLSSCVGCIAINSRVTLKDKLEESDCSLF